MKVLKFKVSNDDTTKQILISNNDSILGLVCAILSSIGIHKSEMFELHINDKIITLGGKAIDAKIQSIGFKENCCFRLRCNGEVINGKFLESRYVTNETFCNYPALDDSNKTARNFSENYYFRMLYWDLKFKYTKLLNKKIAS